MSIIKVKTGGITADAITDALIADDVVGTEHLTANEVDTTALGADAVTGAQLADDAINSEHYTDGSIDTAHIADANVTTAKLASTSVTAAKLNADIISGTTALTSTPADTDEFLVSNSGVLNRVDYSLIKGGGAYQFVERNAVGSSNVGSMNIANLATTGENYLFTWNGIDSADNSNEDFLMQISLNGSSFRTSGYKSACFQFYSDGGEDSFSSSSGFVMSENQTNNDTAEGNSGFAYLMNIPSGEKTMLMGQNVVVGDSNRVRANTFGGMYDTGETTTAVRFLFGSGDISANTVGFVTVYKQVIA